jgi:hypothetical protein
LIGGLVRLGRRIPPWNQWPEGFWRDPKLPSFVGDMPDIRIGEEYTPALRSLFACEREAHEYLVITPGGAEGWLDDAGKALIRNLPTCCGKVSQMLHREAPDETCVVRRRANLRCSGDSSSSRRFFRVPLSGRGQRQENRDVRCG